MKELNEWLEYPLSLGPFVSSNLEVLGFVTGAVCVYLNTRQNVLGWFFGIVNAVLYGLVFFKARLYADTALQGYYFVTSIYGWWMWLYGGSGRAELSVSDTPRRLYRIFAVLFCVVTLLWGFVLNRYTDASYGYLDSALTVGSLIGQWMMARKYLQNWLLWIVVDVAYVLLFYIKGLHLTSLLYVIFTVLAAWGYIRWRQSLRAQERT